MIIKFKKFILLVFTISLLSAGFCQAAFLKPNTQIEINEQAAKSAVGYDTSASNDLFSLAQAIINAFLSIIGSLLLIYMLYAGYNWMTAMGDEEKVTRAKDTIKRAIIGLAIIIAAYAISVFVVSRLQTGILKDSSSSTKTTTETSG